MVQDGQGFLYGLPYQYEIYGQAYKQKIYFAAYIDIYTLMRIS